MANGIAREHKFVYLACPHTHPDPEMEKKRERYCMEITAALIRLGLRVYSPISYTGPLKRTHLPDLTHGEWMMLDAPFVEAAECLFVLCIPGWRESAGIAAEIVAFEKRERPIFYITPNEFMDRS